MDHPELLLIFFVIAFVYASVGFGGGSSYLAILALYALPFKELRLIALTCNIVVVTGSAIVYIRHNQINWQKLWPLILLSVPAAYLGASLRIEQKTFYILLGCSLIVAAVLICFRQQTNTTLTVAKIQTSTFTKHGLLGGSVGFLSGLVGIGGGIFLAPVLHLINWDIPKKIAAASSIFILSNSLAGIAGQLSLYPFSVNFTQLLLLCATVFIGGQLGTRVSFFRFNPVVVKYLTAAVIFVAGAEVLYRHLPLLKEL